MSHIQKASRSQVPRGWLDPDVRDRSRTFTRKADAERDLAIVEGAKLSGTAGVLTHCDRVRVADVQWPGGVPTGRPQQRESLP
jgi:hypothetical protein